MQDQVATTTKSTIRASITGLLLNQSEREEDELGIVTLSSSLSLEAGDDEPPAVLTCDALDLVDYLSKMNVYRRDGALKSKTTAIKFLTGGSRDSPTPFQFSCITQGCTFTSITISGLDIHKMYCTTTKVKKANELSTTGYTRSCT